MMDRRELLRLIGVAQDAHLASMEAASKVVDGRITVAERERLVQAGYDATQAVIDAVYSVELIPRRVTA